MERFARDFLCGIGKGDAPPPEHRPVQLREEVELNLELSLGGLYRIDRKGDKLPRASSMAAALTPPVEVTAPPAIPRASGSPSSASSQGDGQRLQGSGMLMRTSSLPAVTEAADNEEWKKRKEAQSLTLEVKKKRIERRNSLTGSTSKEEAGQITEEMNAHTDRLVSCDEAAVGDKENHSSGKHLAKGLPPKYQTRITPSQDCLSAVGKKPNSAFKAITMEHGSASSVPSSSEAIRSVTAASPPPPWSLAPRTAVTLGFRGDQSILGRAAVLQRQTEWGDVERRLMQEMPGVFTKGLPNGNRVEGFLYKYRKGEEVKIICMCHGSLHTPSEFVQHAGVRNGEVDNPLRHIIVVSPTPTQQTHAASVV